MAALFVCAHAADVLYVYDDLGRLRQAVAPDTSNAVYNYDAAGNITSITKNTTTTVAIAWVSPSVGPVGTTVIIYGGGFSTTPANNTVQFNGTTATVSAATANQLTVTVPGGATTGAISVKNTNGSATSGQTYTVGTPATQVPTVTGISPTIGTAGTAVTVTGTNFSTTSSVNRVTFGSMAAGVTSATSTSITTASPSTGGSGVVAVGTPYGYASGSTDFFWVPTGATSDVQYTGRLVVGGSTNTVTTTTNGKKAILIFDGNQNQSVTLSLSGGTFAGNVTYSVYTPQGALLTSNNGIGNSARYFIGTLPVTGTYTILLTPGGTDKGSITAQLKQDVSTTISTTSGSSGSLTVGSGQAAIFNFQAAAGQLVQIEVSGVTIPSSSSVLWNAPDGYRIFTGGTTTTGVSFAGQASAAYGLHSIVIQPSTTTGGDVSVRVGMPDLVPSAYSIGAVTVNQNGTYSFPITYTVTNNGTGSAITNNWYDMTFLSTDATLDSSDLVMAGSFNRSTPLNVNGSYNGSFTATSSATQAPGTYTLFLKTDAYFSGVNYNPNANAIIEANETNNVLSAPITLPGRPDLVPSALSVGTVSANQNGSYNVPITWTVTNNGGSPAVATWYDVCFLSTDATLDSSDRVLAAYARSTNLAASSNYGGSQTCVTQTTTTSGNYTLFLKSDTAYGSGFYNPASNTVVEADDTNNVVSTSITLPAKADLVPSALSVGSISVNQNGSYNVPITWTVTNSGGLTAIATWYDVCFLSTDATLDSSDRVLAAYARSTNLAASSNYGGSQTCVTQTTTTSGNYTLFLKTDTAYASGFYNPASNTVVEQDDTNNVVSTSITLPAKADLVPSALSVGTIVKNANNSYTIPITFTVTNSGGSAAVATWYDSCFLSSDGTLDSGDARLGSQSHATNLSASSNYGGSISCTTSTTTAAGTYTLFVKTDTNSTGTVYNPALNAVGEQDETNNVVSTTVVLP